VRRWGLPLAGALAGAAAIAAAWVMPPRPVRLAPATVPAGPAVAAHGSPSATPALAPLAAPKATPKSARAKARVRAATIERVERVLARRMPTVDPAERSRLASAILDEARGAAIDPLFVLALIAVESGYDHGAESVRGARGLMQLRPSTLASEAERSNIQGDLDDPVVNVRAGVRYCGRLVRAFGDTDVALMAYNAGPNRILKYLREEGAIPERFHGYPQKVRAEHVKLVDPAAAAPKTATVAPTPAAVVKAGEAG
jgi:soluble lytic murein transglycosylase-like protein